ncbi:uncharacterized protein TRIADDRAFT_62577 [Trichoplax adhaerens]|uniref:Uncharacterized protein n=1 Tax=Trichoplax adhaerens TaxID=10228 RepID=B3SE79_TRIAD|nr:predicted protein [Trichoplax adhaerens]EDV18964.1 predicted protein [Trichoplax adhaerens]|eukprot:XP_002118548.1 predicted protein [Trichoplax adhaerens]
MAISYENQHRYNDAASMQQKATSIRQTLQDGNANQLFANQGEKVQKINQIQIQEIPNQDLSDQVLQPEKGPSSSDNDRDVNEEEVTTVNIDTVSNGLIAIHKIH